jgi:hypothetical protein
MEMYRRAARCIVDVVPRTVLWGISAAVILWLFSYLSPDEPNFDTLNEAARFEIFLLFVGHAVAYSVLPALTVFVGYLQTKVQLIGFLIAGVIVVWWQLALRSFRDGIGRMDCWDNCVPSVMPLEMGEQIAFGLGGLLIGLWLLWSGLAILWYKRRQRG